MPKKILYTGAEVSLESILNQEDQVIDNALWIFSVLISLIFFQAKKQVLIGRRGATVALCRIAKDAGETLPSQMSPLWDAMSCQLSDEIKPSGLRGAWI